MLDHGYLIYEMQYEDDGHIVIFIGSREGDGIDADDTFFNHAPHIRYHFDVQPPYFETWTHNGPESHPTLHEALQAHVRAINEYRELVANKERGS
jgi:hypothetical protein